MKPTLLPSLTKRLIRTFCLLLSPKLTFIPILPLPTPKRPLSKFLPHGYLLNWLKVKFNFKERMTQRFMMIAEVDNSTLLIAMLALPSAMKKNLSRKNLLKINPPMKRLSKNCTRKFFVAAKI